MPFPAAMPRQPLVVLMIAILTIPEDGSQAREGPWLQFPHDFLGPHPVIHAGRCHHNGHQQSQRVHHDMTLTAIDLLATVVAMLATDLGGLHRLAIDTDSAGAGLPLAFGRRDLILLR